MNRSALAISVALLAACSATTYSPPASAIPGSASPAVGAAPCVPEIVLLPPLDGDNQSALRAMNDRGWVVGSSGRGDPYMPDNGYDAAVMWREGTVFDLGIGGGLLPNGKVSSSAVDMNDDGVVAAQRVRWKGTSKVVGYSAWLWHDGEKTRLEGGRHRGRAVVEAVNDPGVAIGYVSSGGWHNTRPASWQDGELVRLPVPRGAYGAAEEINDDGLIVGWVRRRGTPAGQPWYWQLGGSSGPLQAPSNGGWPGSANVDDRGRILVVMLINDWSSAVVWRSPESEPLVIEKRALARTTDMNSHGDLSGAYAGFRGIGGHAWVASLRTERVVRLPDPGVGINWESVQGTSVIRGVTSFAPQGGVSVGGNARSYDVAGDHRATVWTCAQTY